MVDVLSEVVDRDTRDVLRGVERLVMARGVGVVVVESRLLDHDARQEEAEAGADVVEHLTDAGGGHPLPRGEPGGGHQGRRRAEDDPWGGAG